MIRRVRKLHNPFTETPDEEVGSKKGTIEWHEAVIDSKSEVEEQSEQATDSFKASFLKPLCFLVLGILISRLLFLQVIRGSDYTLLSEGNRTRKLSLLAPRGLIEDRNGESLAQNTASFRLVAIPFDLPKEGLGETINSLSMDLGLNPDEVKRQIESSNRSSFEPILIKNDLSSRERLLFETKESKYPGFAVLTIPVRDYRNPEIYSHILGYSSVISEKELKQYGTEKYQPIDMVGKSGVELTYEKFLKGVNGREEIEVDAKGRLTKVIGEIDPKTGNTLRLTIDKQLQEELYKYFSVGKSGNRGAAIAMNPKTGEILAFLSLPGFNNNLFGPGISEEDYRKLLEDKSLPLFNRAISGTYPPGSTVKPMVALAALEEGVVKEDTIINDNGKLVIPNQYNPSVSYDFVGWKRDGLGPMNVKSAIAKSSDIYFYAVSGGHPSLKINSLGINRLSTWYRRFNVGKLTGIDLPGEKPGVVADPAWKAEYFKGDAVLSKWYLGDTYHVGIGQGDMLVTPLQVATWTSIVANSGIGMQPHLLKEVLDSDGKVVYKGEERVVVPRLASMKNIKIVQEGMRQTVTDGSGVQLSTLPVSSAGKTGTSQFDGSDPKRTHAWFTAYAPYEDPQIVITILVEAGGEGHAAAVPIAKNVLQWWAENRYVK